MKRAFVTSLLVVGMGFGSVASTYAAKGGSGGNGGSAKLETPNATLNYDCDSTLCYAGNIVYFSGEGYDAVQGKALLQIGASLWSNVAVADDGTVNFHWNFFTIPGTYPVQLYQNGKGNKLELKGAVSVTIE